MYAGGSGEFSMTHVKFMVDPLSMYKSGAPMISVDGSVSSSSSAGIIRIEMFTGEWQRRDEMQIAKWKIQFREKY